MKAAGYIQVERDDRKKSYQAFIQTVEKVKQGNSVIIFPEGTRSEDGTVGPFKKGSNLIASRSHSPMVPVTIIGSGDIIKKGSAIINPGTVQIILSPAIINHAKDDGEILNSIHDTICANLKTMS